MKSSLRFHPEQNEKGRNQGDDSDQNNGTVDPQAVRCNACNDSTYRITAVSPEPENAKAFSPVQGMCIVADGGKKGGINHCSSDAQRSADYHISA